MEKGQEVKDQKRRGREQALPRGCPASGPSPASAHWGPPGGTLPLSPSLSLSQWEVRLRRSLAAGTWMVTLLVRPKVT